MRVEWGARRARRAALAPRTPRALTLRLKPPPGLDEIAPGAGGALELALGAQLGERGTRGTAARLGGRRSSCSSHRSDRRGGGRTPDRDWDRDAAGERGGAEGGAREEKWSEGGGEAHVVLQAAGQRTAPNTRRCLAVWGCVCSVAGQVQAAGRAHSLGGPGSLHAGLQHTAATRARSQRAPRSCLPPHVSGSLPCACRAPTPARARSHRRLRALRSLPWT